jgi:4-hydroxy-tetrahydrodipicolinate reductase
MSTINVMVNGLPGNVTLLVAEHILADDRFTLVPFSLTGPEIEQPDCQVAGLSVKLLRPDIRDQEIGAIRSEFEEMICVDYTHPSAVNANAEFYCRHRLPFVMGTTGGDRDRLIETVNAAALPAVIAPNMAKQIVGFQAIMAYGAREFPGLFSGYSLEIRESHQEGKADTSGTAKAMVQYFNRMGVSFDASGILMERDPERQRTQWGIPEAYLKGHAWHTYTLVSEDQSVTFSFTHNVNGRKVYALGTLDALVFLEKKIREKASPRVYSMIDVLRDC